MSTHKFPAELRARELDSIISSLNEHCKRDGTVQLDGSEIKKVDTAGMQTLVILAHHLRQEGRTFSWTATSPLLIESAHCLGASDILGLPAQVAA